MKVIKVFNSAQAALASVINLTSAEVRFEYDVIGDGKVRIQAGQEAKAILQQHSIKGYIVVQEGGSSTELYVHAHPTLADAEDDRQICAAAGYRTSPVTEVPEVLLALGSIFYSALDAVVSSTVAIDYVEVSQDIDTLCHDAKYGFLVSLGYLVEKEKTSDGEWFWKNSAGLASGSFTSSSEAVAGAWQHAETTTKQSAGLSEQKWDSLHEQEQLEIMISTLASKSPPRADVLVPDEV